MLDTNIASYIIKGQPPEVRQQLEKHPMTSIVISAVTQGELLYGIARKGYPEGLLQVVEAFLHRVDVLPWDDDVARIYADLRAECTKQGLVLSALDMMIASHAAATDCTLITHDKAFKQINDHRLKIEDWIKP